MPARGLSAAGDQEARQGGARAGEGLGAASDAPGRRDRREQPPDVGESARCQRVGAPGDGRPAVGEGDGHVTGGQPGAHVPVAGLVQAGDGDHHVPAVLQGPYDVGERFRARGDLVGEPGDVLEVGAAGDHDVQARPAGGVEDGLGEGVDRVVGQAVGVVAALPQAAQGVGVQDEGVGDLQLPQALPAAHEDAGPGEERAESRAEGGRSVPGRLRGSGKDRFGRFPRAVGDEEGGGGAGEAAGAGVGGVLLGGCHLERRAGARRAGHAGAPLAADVVVQRLEGRGSGHGFGQLGAAQHAVEHQGQR